MDKLGQVTIENCVNLKVNCEVDQSLLAKNFNTIIEALKELQKCQADSDSKLKDLAGLREKVDKLAEGTGKSENASSSESK